MMFNVLILSVLLNFVMNLYIFQHEIVRFSIVQSKEPGGQNRPNGAWRPQNPGTQLGEGVRNLSKETERKSGTRFTI